MALIKCMNSHFYDKDKYSECPFCKNKSEDYIDEDNNKTVGLIEDVQRTQSYSENVDGMDKTIGVYGLKMTNKLVCGWLVVVKGKMKGESFPIYYGKNVVGRSLKMDISLSIEEQVTRYNHFSVVYENKMNEFYVVQGDSPIMLNNELVSGYEVIKDGDVISFADVEVIFVPYCKKGRKWDE